MRSVLGGGGVPDGTGLLGRPSYSWEANVKMDLKETGMWGLECYLFIRV